LAASAGVHGRAGPRLFRLSSDAAAAQARRLRDLARDESAGARSIGQAACEPAGNGSGDQAITRGQIVRLLPVNYLAADDSEQGAELFDLLLGASEVVAGEDSQVAELADFERAFLGFVEVQVRC